MKLFNSSLPDLPLFIRAAIAVVTTLLGSASAQLVAYDDAGNYRVTANWTNGANQGFGFTPWTFATNTPTSTNFHEGWYIPAAVVNPPFAIASITNVTGTNYTNIWGIYANGTNGINETIACRGFASPLGTNTFKIQWGAKGAGSTTVRGVGTVHGWCGFTLRNGNAATSGADFQTGAMFYLYFLDGASPSTIYVWDGNGVQSLTGTSFSNLGRTTITNAVEAEVTVGADGSSYHLVLKDCVQNKTLYTLDSTLLGSGTIDSVALFCHETTGDQVYNRMQIAVPTLVPPTIVNIQPTNGSLYLDPSATSLTFEVDSFNSTISSNFVSVYLNGALKTGTTFNTASPTSQLLGTNNTPLALNTFYTLAILAQDANGNVTSNGVTFNTFSPNNLCIDAMDYNYNAGQYLPNPAPAQFGGLLGTNGIDYLDLTTSTNWNDYRPGAAPLPQLIPIAYDATGDPVDHNGFIANSLSDYQIAFTDLGEWENYTRNFPTTNYTVYARAASAGGGQFQLDQLANPTATTSNQPLAVLGSFVVPPTGGSKVYSGQLTPLADPFGNTVVLRLSGTTTLRQTAVQSRTYNLSYLMFVPNASTNLLKPYISVASPAPGAAGVALDSPITFTIANRQTAVNPATVKLSLNASDVTSRLTLSNNAAGTAVAYSPAVFLQPNTTNSLTAIFTDSTGTNSVTNSWSFISANQTLTALTNALPASPSATRGFGLSLYKIDNAGPEPGTIASAFLQLNGLVTNGLTLLPWSNEINSSFSPAYYLETNTLDYDTSGAATGTYTFAAKSGFPDISTNGLQQNFVMQALFYLQLNAGSYHLVVRSDDGFGLNAGPTPATAAQVLGQFNGGRANTTPTDIYLTAPSNGYYPMNLLYFQESGGGSLEFYSLSNGTPILINDPSNPNSLKAFAVLTAAPISLLNAAHAGSTTTFSFQTQLGFTHYVEYKNALTDPTWTPLTNYSGDGSTANVTDTTASGTTRFYRVRTQ